MPAWRQVARGLRALVNGDAADRDVADEVASYLDELTDAYVARGLSHDEARRAAHVELGGATHVREQVRGSGWENTLETLFADLRYGLRRLRAAPTFTAVTVLTLGLGIGGTTAIFSAVNSILFKPLAYPQPDRLVSIVELAQNGARNAGTFGIYHGLAERSRFLAAIAVAKPWQPASTGFDQPERLEGRRITHTYFRALGVAPALGRDFQLSDDRVRGPSVTVLSDRLWRRRFSADPAIIGKQISLDDSSYVVIGVMPRGFEDALSPQSELWAPLQYDMSLGRAWGHHLQTIARLRDRVSVEQASRELDGIGNAILAEEHPASYGAGVRFAAISLQDELTRSVQRALLVILAAVAVVLAIACANVANLLLARGVQRDGEFALRAALGAARGRLIRQMLTENLLLAAIGGTAGIAIAIAGVRGLVALSPPGLPRVDAIAIDRAALVFAFSVTTLIGLMLGVVPALNAARQDPHRALQVGSRRIGGGHRRVRGMLVVGEVALALILLVTSGLLLRSLQRLFAVPAGFNATRVLTVQVQASGNKFIARDAPNRFYEQALDAVRRVPGVESAGFTSQLPLSGDRDEYGVRLEGTTAGYNTFRYAVSPTYIATIGIPLKRGRMLETTDRADAPPVALVSEALANHLLPGLDPIGRRISIGGMQGITIVGVVGNVRQLSLSLDERDAVYTTEAQWQRTSMMSFVVRAHGKASDLAQAVRQAIWSVDKDQPIVRVATMDELVSASAAERRFALILFEAFGLTALLLAAAGIYGVLSGGVAERRREIGVRSALGASRRSIVSLVLRHGLSLTALGVIIGLAGAAAATRSISSMLFGVSRLDPMTYLGVVALLGVAALAACALPAWRAARVDAVETLRAE